MRRTRRTSETMLHHLRELRTRLCIVAVVFLASSSLAYYFRDEIIGLLLSPLGSEKLIYLNPAGGFNFIFLVSIYAGAAITLPLLLQQTYAFLRPALPKVIKHYSSKIFVSSLGLLVAGMAFGYYVAIPSALHFLTSFADTYVSASLTADSYLNFVVAYTLGVGLLFQTPLLIMFTHWIHPLTPGGILKSERWIIPIAFTVAAIVTPTPDPLNQTLIAAPLIAIYQLGAISVLYVIWRDRRKTRREQARVKKLTTHSRPVVQQQPNTARPWPTAALPAQKTAPQPVAPKRNLALNIDGVIRTQPATLPPKSAADVRRGAPASTSRGAYLQAL